MNRVYVLTEPAQATPIWFSRITDGLRISCQQHRLTMVQIEDAAKLDALEEKPAAVLALCSQDNWTRHAVRELQARQIMPILLGVVPERFGDSVSGIVMARRVFIEKAVDYFVDNGRRRLALVGVNRNASNDSVKIGSFLQYCRAKVLPVTQEDVYCIDTDIVGCVTRCLDSAARYDAVICSNDYVAAALLAQARERGIRVPESLFVIGLGDTRIGRYTEPSLTTTTTSDEYFEMGRMAVNIWQLISENPSLASITISVNTRIIPRGSTAFAQPQRRDLQPEDDRPPKLHIGDVNQVIRNLENCLRRCDELDMRILRAVMAGLSNEQIEAELYLAHSSLHYRLRRLYQFAHVASRAELEAHFRYYLPHLGAPEDPPPDLPDPEPD